MTDEAVPHKRRVRYVGTHPRRFEEKYKELNPEQHGLELQKVLDRGQTPAGMHRSICIEEILQLLAPQPGEVGLDATLGFGGHAQELLAKVLPGGRLFGIDVDPIEFPRTEARLRAKGFDASMLVLNGSIFRNCPICCPKPAVVLIFCWPIWACLRCRSTTRREASVSRPMARSI